MITILNEIKSSIISELTIQARLNDAIDMIEEINDPLTPEKLIDFAVEAIKGDFNSYTHIYGKKELKRKVSQLIYEDTGVEFDPETEIIMTLGSTEGIAISIFSQIEGEMNVVIPEPYYENYVPVVLLARGKPFFLKLKRNSFNITEQELEQLPPYKMIILNSPHNPTGRIFDKNEISKIGKNVLEKEALILWDETNKYICFEKEYFTPLKMKELVDRTIVVGSFSKFLSVTGWRIGYLAAKENLMKDIKVVHDYIGGCAPAPFQWALEQFKIDDAFKKKYNEYVKEKKDFWTKILKKSGFEFQQPEGGCYVFCSFENVWDGNDWAFSQYLLKNKKIAVAPGSIFFNDKKLGEKYIRFNFLKSKTQLKMAGNRLLAGFG